MKPTIFLSLLALFCLLGCHTRPSTRTVALLDVSGSIYPEEVDREFKEMQELASHLQRGDQLILIPIMGNARNDTPGRIVRLFAPTGRMPFDSDLVGFRKDAKEQIERMRDRAKRNPARHTDIFGTLDVAQSEFHSVANLNTKLIILSDFIEDDGTWDFAAKRDLPTRQQAMQVTGFDPVSCPGLLNGSTITLERLRSWDRGALSVSRLIAVDAFWNRIFADSETNVHKNMLDQLPHLYRGALQTKILAVEPH